MRYRRMDAWIRNTLELMARKTGLPLRDGTLEHKFRVDDPAYTRVWIRHEMEEEDRTY